MGRWRTRLAPEAAKVSFRLEGRDQHFVDDVDHAVAGTNVGDDDRCIGRGLVGDRRRGAAVDGERLALDGSHRRTERDVGSERR